MYKRQCFFKEKNQQTRWNFIGIKFVLMHISFLSKGEGGMIKP